MEAQACVSAADQDEADRHKEAEVLDNVRRKLQGMYFGQIIVVVQKGKVCRVDKLEQELLS